MALRGCQTYVGQDVREHDYTLTQILYAEIPLMSSECVTQWHFGETPKRIELSEGQGVPLASPVCRQLFTENKKVSPENSGETL